jgi:acetylornithine deacetylase
MERRTLPGEPATTGIDEVTRICQELSDEDPTFRVIALQKFSRPAYEIPRNHELTRALAESLSRVGGTPVIAGASFWTDAAILGQAGIPSVLFGPGGAGLHSVEEHVVLDDVLRCRDALADLARSFC